MNIIRAPRQGNFTIVPNETARDRGLSYRALGILVELLSHDDGWETNAERIASKAKEGRDAIRTALRELEANRYMVRKKSRNSLGRWEYAQYVYDSPQPEAPDDPDRAPLSLVDPTAPVDSDLAEPVENHPPHSAGEQTTAPRAAKPQVRPSPRNPLTENPPAEDPSVDGPRAEDREPVDPVPADRPRRTRRYQEASLKKTDQKTPPPTPAPDAATTSPNLVEEGVRQLLLALPDPLLPRSPGQTDALREAVVPYLAAGWPVRELLDRAAYPPFPEQIHSPAGFLRQRLAALSVARPISVQTEPWCGECDEYTRHRDQPETGRYFKCPVCHPAVVIARREQSNHQA